MTTHRNMVEFLATELQHWLWKNEKIGSRAPSPESIAEFIEKHMRSHGQSITASQKNESAKVPALLKSKPAVQDAKRTRELAGIPHKGNFV